MEKEFEILKKINKIEVSPFLYTRIVQKIENSKLNDIAKPWAWTLASFSAICLVLTIIVVNRNFSNQDQVISESINLIPNNSLYYE